VQRLLCDCSVVTVTEDASGNPLDVGRKQRTVSTALRRALHARDRYCTFPGCRRNRYLDGHHLEHWLNGGETNPDNMTLLCTYHHRLLHEGGFRIVKEEAGTLRFVTADGRSIPRNGYRLEDFVDDDVDGKDDGELNGRAGGRVDGEIDAGNGARGHPSREGFRTTPAQSNWEHTEVREPAAIYRLQRMIRSVGALEMTALSQTL